MNQQNQGLGIPSNVPMKRKRGRPRKDESVVHRENMPGIHKSDNVLNSNQTVGTTDDCDDDIVGKAVTGVIEGTFNAGYLLNVKVPETDTALRGLVFLPGQVNPVTAENDVAPHVKMIKRKEFPIPMLNTQTEVHGSGSGSVPAPVQCSKQSFEPEIQVPISGEQVLPTEIHSGISVSLENQSASTMIPVADLPKNETTILSEPEHVRESGTIMSELECDKTVKQGDTLQELDASTQEKESSADGDGGETRDSAPASEPINLVPTIENTEKELRTEQQAVPSVHQLNELVQDEPNSSDIQLNPIPLAAELVSMQSEDSEQTSKSVDNFVEKQDLPETDLLR